MNNNWLGLEGDICVITGAVGGMKIENTELLILLILKKSMKNL